MEWLFSQNNLFRKIIATLYFVQRVKRDDFPNSEKLAQDAFEYAEAMLHEHLKYAGKVYPHDVY